MPVFRADFNVKSSLALAAGNTQLLLSANDPEIVIRNAELDSSGHVAALDIQVVGESKSMDTAINDLRNLLAQKLDILSFATHAIFQIEQCSRVIEWEPNQKTRAFRAMQKFDPLYPPEPNLDSRFAETVQIVAGVNLEEYIQRALRYFRYGVIGKQPGDQFQNFWLVLEIIAENKKGANQVPVACVECDGPMVCSKCGNTPQCRLMAKEAIKNLVTLIVKPDPKKMFKDLDMVRNALLHGRLPESIEVEVGRPLSTLVNEAGAIAWNAIMSSLPKFDKPLTIGHRGDNFVSGELIAGPTGWFDHTEVGEHPAEEKIPKINIKLDVQFTPFNKKG